MNANLRVSSTQQEAISLLTELCALSSDVRLGQLMAHLGFLGEDETNRTLWDIDDEQLLAIMYRHRSELMARTSPSTQPIDLATGASLVNSPMTTEPGA
jgi:hypothetical protein